jgi:hypothetical protein
MTPSLYVRIFVPNSGELIHNGLNIHLFHQSGGRISLASDLKALIEGFSFYLTKFDKQVLV